MARKVKTEKSKKQKVFKIILTIVICLLVVVAIGFLLYKFVFNKKDNKTPIEVKILDKLDDYGYTLSDRDSKYYKTEYEALKKIVNNSPVDEEAYATQVAKLFVIDLYSLNTKVNKYDVGGVEFFYSDKVSMHEKKVMDTLYKTMQDDTYGDRKQILPEVSEVSVVSVEKGTYKFVDTKKVNGKEEKTEREADAYIVKFNIKYVSDLGYDDKGTIVLCKEENSIRWSVVEFDPSFDLKL